MAAQQAHDLVIEPDGTIRFVFDETLSALFADEPEQRTVRASHVEPSETYGLPPGRWVADLTPSQGPILLGASGAGYRTRDEALLAEREWLRAEWGL